MGLTGPDVVLGTRGHHVHAVARAVESAGQVGGGVDQAVIKKFEESRVWVLVASIVAFVCCALLLIGSFLILLSGARVQSQAMVIQAITGFFSAVLYGTFGFLTLNYAQSIMKLRMDRSAVALNATLIRLNRIWLFVGIVLIVVIVVSVVAVIVSFAVGGSFLG